MKVYLSPKVSVYGNYNRKKSENSKNYMNYNSKKNYSPSFGATFFGTIAKHMSIAGGTGATVGAHVGGVVDLGTFGTTLGVPTATCTAVGTVIGGATGMLTGTVHYFVDKKNAKERERLEKENKELENKKTEIEQKQRALAEQEAASNKKNAEALAKQQAVLAEQRKLIEILQNFNAKALEIKKGIGLGTTAGYAEDKAALNEVFLSPYRKSFDSDNILENHIPNGILLYGLSGNGKTTLAKGIIQELLNDENTDTAFYDLSDISRKDLQEKLSAIKEKAEQEFNEKGRRTLILMDEFDGLAPNPNKLTQLVKGEEAENKSNSYLKNFMNDCSDYGITIIATTNYPQNIESPFLINNNRFEVKTVIEPPNEDDISQILEYYLDGVTEGKINYQEAAKLMMNNARNKEAKYSCSCVESVANKAKAFAAKNKRMVNQDDILKFANTAKPDLSKKYMEQFKDDFECVTGSTYEEYLEQKKSHESEI